MDHDPEIKEILLFITAQLFRLECDASKANHYLVSLREKHTPGGLDAMIHDPNERMWSRLARRSICHEYEELLEGVQSPALRELLQSYLNDWCDDLDDPPPPRNTRKRRS